MDNNYPNQMPGQMPQQAPGQPPYLPPAPPKGKAGCWGIVGSFLIPILGVILFFTMKDKVEDTKPYLYAAIAGFVIGLILNFVVTPMLIGGLPTP